MSDKILIVDDLVTNRIILKVKLKAACHDVLEAGNGEEALLLARRELPRLILLDMGLPDLSGIEVCRQLRSDPATRHTPIIVISASSHRSSRLEALMAGADDFLGKPLNEAVLMARIRCLLRVSQSDADLRMRVDTCRALGLAEASVGFEHAPRIALIAGDHAMASSWRSALAQHLPGQYRPMSPSEALAGTTGADAPDLYVIAADLAAPGDSLRLIADLRARAGTQPAGLCLALADPGHEIGALALDLGANDLVPLPLDPQETSLRLRLQLTRQRQAEALRQAVRDGLAMAATDPLTGLHNRRYALAHLERIAVRAVQTGSPYAVIVLDIDRFKQVNDIYGHAAGDSVLEEVAKRLSASLRPSDLLARIGGEEFLVVLPETTLADASSVAERLCAAVSDSPVVLREHAGAVTVTLSAGMTLAPMQPVAPRPDERDRSEDDARVPGGQPNLNHTDGKGDPSRHCTRSSDQDGDCTHRTRLWTEGSTRDMSTQRRGAEELAGLDLLAADTGSAPSPAPSPAPAASGDGVVRDWGSAAGQTVTAKPIGQYVRQGPVTGLLPREAVREALARADSALLAAKAQGRNKITVSSVS